MNDEQEFIDLIEIVYRGARKGGLPLLYPISLLIMMVWTAAAR